MVLALVITLVLVTRDDQRSDGMPRSPRDAVQSYLQALADADADRARAVTTPAPSTALLGGDVLRRQRDLAPITDIEVSEPVSDGVVSARYRIGDRLAEVGFRTVAAGGGWLVSDGVLELRVAPTRVPHPTLFGTEITANVPVYVYPGPREWGSRDPYVGAKDADGQPFPVGPQPPSTVRLDPELTAAGHAAVSEAVQRHLTYCAGSREPDAAVDRPGCRQHLNRSAVPGTVRWTAPSDTTGLFRTLSTASVTTVDVAGAVSWQATYTPSYAADTTRTAVNDDYLVGSVDLTAKPPLFTEG